MKLNGDPWSGRWSVHLMINVSFHLLMMYIDLSGV